MFSATFPILRIIIIDVHWSSCKNFCYSCQILVKLILIEIFEKHNTKFHDSLYHKSRIVPCGLTDTHRQDKGNSRISQFYKCD